MMPSTSPAPGSSVGSHASKPTADAGMVTLTRYLLANQLRNAPSATGDFTLLMQSVQLACKAISSSVRQAGLLGLYGLQGSVNVQGEEVKKLDAISHDVFVSALASSGRAAVLVSEEKEEAIIVGDAGKYCVVFDPLDGSSNIDVNGTIGSIFGIYHREGDLSKPASASDVLIPGARLVAAGYAMYGSSTQMVISWGTGVHIFTLDPAVGEFVLTAENAKIPENPQTIYSLNEGNSRYYSPELSKLINYFKFEAAKPYSARYVGSLVADGHRTLIYGGVFAYPNDSKNPNGKLRLLYEVNPFSFLIEQAGGVALSHRDGKLVRALDIVPKTIHDRVPLFFGCKRDMDIVRSFYEGSAGAPAASPSKKA